MSHDLTDSENRLPDRESDLARLAECANQAHEKVAGAMQQAVMHALDAGKALLEAKSICHKGAWTKWLQGNFCASVRTAQGYMRLVVYWNQVGGDPQSIAGLNFSEATRMLKGLACSDGRANPTRGHVQKRLTAADATMVPPNQPPSVDAAQPNPPLPVALSGDPFEVIAKLLEQAVNELRRLRETRPDHARYARHLLQPLERIRSGIATRRWFWDMIKR
jgi:hypothetical protein